MGSYNYTCAVSKLPIYAGTPVRYLLVTESPYRNTENAGCQAHTMDAWWFLRTFPIRASYNDYGTVEDVQEGPARDIWLEALAKDLVPVGVGDNTAHDVETNADMSFEELLDAIREVRVLVKQDFKRGRVFEELVKAQPSAGIPTLERVQEALKDLPRYKHYGDDGFIVDEVEYGTVRVRHPYRQELEHVVAKLKMAQERLSEYATVITAGSGNYPDKAELKVCVKPGADFYGAPPDLDKGTPLIVSHVMIREDVWQVLLTLSISDGWSNDEDEKTIVDYRAEYLACYKKRLEEAKADALLNVELDNATPEVLVLSLESELRKLNRSLGNEGRSRILWINQRENIPFTIGPASHWDLFMEKQLPVEEAADFINSAAELAYVYQVLMQIRHIWLPSVSCGPQCGEFSKHSDFLSAVGTIANNEAKGNDE